MMVELLNCLYWHNKREYWHSIRVGELAFLTATSLDMSYESKLMLKITGMLHDIGKISIKNEILNKCKKLSEYDYKEIIRHPYLGEKLLQVSREYSNIVEGVLYHHERWNGNGYPYKLKGYQIPPYARIIAIIDSFDAMVSERPYKDATSIDAACSELLYLKGELYDPELTNDFCQVVIEHKDYIDEILLIGKQQLV